VGVKQLEILKKEIEEYRKLLEEELKTDKGLDKVERIIELSHKLDKLIVRYEQTIKNGNQNR